MSPDNPSLLPGIDYSVDNAQEIEWAMTTCRLGYSAFGDRRSSETPQLRPQLVPQPQPPLFRASSPLKLDFSFLDTFGTFSLEQQALLPGNHG